MFRRGHCAGQEDAEVHSLQAMTEQFQPCEWRHSRLRNNRCSEMISGIWAAPAYPSFMCTPLQYFSHEG
jgi:hypothetical protein